LSGIYTHGGHSYGAKDPAGVKKISEAGRFYVFKMSSFVCLSQPNKSYFVRFVYGNFFIIGQLRKKEMLWLRSHQS
jgi:hypothetical protein